MSSYNDSPKSRKNVKRKVIKAKLVNYFSLMREKGPKSDPDSVVKEINEHDNVQDKQMFLKRGILWYGMVCYAMVSHAMI